MILVDRIRPIANHGLKNDELIRAKLTKKIKEKNTINASHHYYMGNKLILEILLGTFFYEMGN